MAASDAALRPLFPLPLVPFEQLLLLDDRDSHPMTCGAEFTFDGQFCRSKLASAIEKALQRHPLFASQVESGPSGRLHWIPAQVLPEVRWHRGAMPLLCHSPSRVDLFAEAGLRIHAYEGASQSKLFFEFHHACSDGAGGLRFVEDLLSLYANSCPSAGRGERDLPQLRPRALTRRGLFDAAHGLSWQRLKNEWQDLMETIAFLRSVPIPLARAAPRIFAESADVSTGHVASIQFRSDETCHYRTLAGQAGATINDLLVTSLLLGIREWNYRCGENDPQDLYRIMLPWNMRTRLEGDLPATNCISFAFLQRRAADLSDRLGLLRAVAAETDDIRQRNIPARVMSKLRLLRYIPGALPYLLDSGHCHATAVLSNVGDPTRRFRTRFPRERGKIVAGNVALADFRALSPIRPQTHASFFVHTYAERLNITAWLDAGRYNMDETRQILRYVVGNLGIAVQSEVSPRRACGSI